MWRILLNMRLRLEIVTAEYITEILFRNSVLLVHRFDNILYPVDKEDGTQDMEQRAQWSAPAWAAYCAVYSISYVPSSLSTGYTFVS